MVNYIKNVKNENIEYFCGQVSKVLKIESIVNSKIKILTSIDKLELTKIENSTIIVGPVKTSILISECKNCILGLVCRQLRIHDSQELKIWLTSCTLPLIEHCKNLVFDIREKNNSNYYEMYKSHLKDAEIEDSELVKKENFSVSDLNWLRFQPSPNWSMGIVYI